MVLLASMFIVGLQVVVDVPDVANVVTLRSQKLIYQSFVLSDFYYGTGYYVIQLSDVEL
jgi:hypothetical protein